MAATCAAAVPCPSCPAAITNNSMAATCAAVVPCPSCPAAITNYQQQQADAHQACPPAHTSWTSSRLNYTGTCRCCGLVLPNPQAAARALPQDDSAIHSRVHAFVPIMHQTPLTGKHKLDLQGGGRLAAAGPVLQTRCSLLFTCCITQCECCTQRFAQGACFEAGQRAGIAGWRLQATCRSEGRHLT